MSSKPLSEELKNKESKLRSNFEKRLALANFYNASEETLAEIHSDYQRDLGSVRTIYKNLVDLEVEKEKKIRGYKSDTLISDELENTDRSFLDYILEKGYQFRLVSHESKQGFNYRDYYEKISEIEKYIDHPDPNKRISGILRDDFELSDDPNLYLHGSYIHYDSYFGGFNLDSLLGAYFIPNVYEIFNISPSEFYNLKSPLNPTSNLECFYVPIKEENFNKILFNLNSCLSMLESEVNSNSKERLRYNLLALSDLLKFGRFFDLVLKVSFNIS